MKKFIIIFIPIILISISTYFYVFSQDSESSEISGYPTFTVQKKTLGQSVVATSILKSKVGAEVKVGAQVSGIVKELYVEIGSKVKKDYLLAKIDPGVYQANLDQASALKEVAYTEKKYAEIELTRAKELFGRKVISDQQLEKALQNFDLSCAKLKQAEADYSHAALQLSYTEITSPISGVVSSITTQKGETVAASFAAPTFVTIIDLKRLELWAYVDETDIGRIKPDQKVLFTVDTYPGELFDGTVETIYPKAEITNNVVNYITVIKIKHREDKILRPEMTANAQIFMDLKEDILTIPKRAVKSENGKMFVNVLNNESVEKRFIKTGISDKKYYEVLSGLAEKDKVILGDAVPSELN
ncbi:MAG: efflux RND transporter periplasmic adaptor subunit [Ignavibacteria bacterium]|jgi:RND family efflux transporter MFP subunit